VRIDQTIYVLRDSQKPILIGKKGQQLKAIGEPVRSRILAIIQNQPATAKQIADRLAATPGAIGHHLHILEAAGLAQVVARRLTRGIVANYYTRTARIFVYDLPSKIAGAESVELDIITTARDDTTVLATLTVRQLNPDTYIVAAVREQDNVPLVRQSGADSVITSSDAVGRLLGLAAFSPNLGVVMEDLLTYGEGLEVAQRDLLVSEVGKAPQSLPDQVIAVVRDEKVYRYFDPVVTQLARGDRLIVVRPARELPWAPRPGTHNEEFATDEP